MASNNLSQFLGFFKRHYILTGLLVIIIGMVGWWKFEFPSATWRYKLIVTVETPEGLKTGSAVREVDVSAQPGLFGVEAKVQHSVKGEAVVVDLGQGQYLFALMDMNGSYKIVRDVFPYNAKNDADYVHYYATLEGQADLKKIQYPTFVTFRDIKDPKSIEAVNSSNLATEFGTGTKLKNITLEMTDERMTWRIEKYLFWLQSRKNAPGFIGGEVNKPFEDPSGTFLTGVEFSRGRFW